MNAPRLLVAPSHTWAELAATGIAELIVSCLRGVPERNVFVALAGGSTPAPVYEALAASTTPIDWSRVELFLSDERMVALDDADSNFRAARLHLTDRIAGQHPLLHPVATELDVDSAARAYDELIRERILPRLKNESLSELGDSACLDLASASICFTTDSYVVKPLFLTIRRMTSMIASATGLACFGL